MVEVYAHELAGVTPTGFNNPLISISDGIKVNQHVYQKMLKYKIVPWVSEVIRDKEIIFQQNGGTLTQPEWIRNFARLI